MDPANSSVEPLVGKSATTTERLISRYHSFNRRPALAEAANRRAAFGAFRRSLRGWLPQEKRTTRVLDIACGEGALLAFLRESGFSCLAGFDLSPENVSLCHEFGLTFVRQSDALRLDELPPEETFDLIFAIDLIEHLPKQKAADFLESVRARLAPGGALILQTPNAGSLFACYNRYYDLSHEFCVTEKSVVDLLMLSGFAAAEIEVRPHWNATTALGYLREWQVSLLHRFIFLGEGSRRPKIPTANLLARAQRTAV